MNQTLIRFLLIILFTSWLTSCANMNPAQTSLPTNDIKSWDTRVATLSAIQSWNLKGLIAIRTPKNSGTANLSWSQQGPQNYHIALYGPLGANSFELTGRPGRIELAGANGKRASASTPEELLAQQLGWRLPISNLYYWIRGLPVPGIAADKKLDTFNHLVVLRQQGWIIQYPRYTSVRRIDIPDKIFLSNSQLNVRIAVSQWQF